MAQKIFLLLTSYIGFLCSVYVYVYICRYRVLGVMTRCVWLVRKGDTQTDRRVVCRPPPPVAPPVAALPPPSTPCSEK